MTGEQAPFQVSLTTDVEALGAAVNGSEAVRAPVAGKVTKVSYVPAAAVTGAATNNRTVSVVNRGQDGTGNTVVATLSFGNGVNAAAYDEKDVPLSGVAGATTVAEGDVLEVRSAAVGTGIADPGGTAIVTIARS